MELFCKIDVAYRPAVIAALPEPGLMLADTCDEPGYIALLEDDTPKDLSNFWTRYQQGEKALKAAGIVAPWEAELAERFAQVKAKCEMVRDDLSTC